MAAILAYLFSCLDETTVLYLKPTGDKPQPRDTVVEYLLSYLKIKDFPLLMKVQEMVKVVLKKKLAGEVSSGEVQCPDRINSCQKKLDLFYQRSYNLEEIDERLFLTNRKKNPSPKNQSPIKKKIQPFERKLDYDADFSTKVIPGPTQQANLPSRRVLDYEKAVTFTKNSNFNELVNFLLILETLQDDSKSLYSQEYDYHYTNDRSHGNVQLAERKTSKRRRC